MKLNTFVKTLATAAAFAFCTASSAANILCEVITKNYMLVPDTQVASCIDAGLGNIGQGGGNDDFLIANPTGYTRIATNTITYDVDSWGFSSSLWSTYSAIAIGFKFGTGNTADEWFVYRLISGVSSGDYTFVGVLAPGGDTGRLSHISLYSAPGSGPGPEPVPEPGTLALLGVGLAGLAMLRRRRCA